MFCKEDKYREKPILLGIFNEKMVLSKINP
jgi:hypothetical protein